MPSHESSAEKIATSSVEEEMDFACSLISDAIAEEGRAKPEKASELLQELTSYIQFRYVGEFELAVEYLAGFGTLFPRDSSRGQQFWSQLCWVAKKMELTSEEKAKLGFPDEKPA